MKNAACGNSATAKRQMCNTFTQYISVILTGESAHKRGAEMSGLVELVFFSELVETKILEKEPVRKSFIARKLGQASICRIS